MGYENGEMGASAGEETRRTTTTTAAAADATVCSSSVVVVGIISICDDRHTPTRWYSTLMGIGGSNHGDEVKVTIDVCSIHTVCV